MQTQLNYNVAVTMRNNGTTTWTPGALYRLGSQNPHDNQIWGPGRIELASAVAPGQQYTFNFQVKAPAPGDYQMQWGMVQDNVQWFGAAAGSQVVVTEDLSRVTFIHTDGLGSPVARTDGAGTVLSRTRYEPYGYVAAGAVPTIGFTGHVHDADTGLTYMQQRYYDPVAGRFLSVDPVTTDANSGGGFNRYAYANNSPYKYVDPDGRFPFLLPFIPYIVGGGTVAVVGHYVLPGRQGREDTARAVGSAILNQGGKGPKPPSNIQPITNPPQAPVIPPDWESRPGRNGGTIYYPPGTEPADGEHIRVMPPGSTPTPGYEDGYWRHVNGNKQPIDPSTGKPGKGQGDTHVPLPPDYVPPPRGPKSPEPPKEPTS